MQQKSFDIQEVAKEQAKYVCSILSFISQKDVQLFESYDKYGVLIETFSYKAEAYGNADEIINLLPKQDC